MSAKKTLAQRFREAATLRAQKRLIVRSVGPARGLGSSQTEMEALVRRVIDDAEKGVVTPLRPHVPIEAYIAARTHPDLGPCVRADVDCTDAPAPPPPPPPKKVSKRHAKLLKAVARARQRVQEGLDERVTLAGLRKRNAALLAALARLPP